MWLNFLNSYSAVANGFRLTKDYERAKEAYEKASKGQEMLSSYPYFLLLQSSSHVLNYIKKETKMIIVSYNLILFIVLNCLSLYFLHKQTRPWDAAKLMESAAGLAKDLSNWREVGDFYRRASELYIECGRAQPASDALAKGAR